MKRHTCPICKRKRYELYMTNIFGNTWACKDEYYFQYCYDHKDFRKLKQIKDLIDSLEKLSIKHLKNR